MPCHQHQSFASIIFKSFFDVRIRSVELLFSSIYDASCGETLYISPHKRPTPMQTHLQSVFLVVFLCAHLWGHAHVYRGFEVVHGMVFPWKSRVLSGSEHNIRAPSFLET